MMKGEKVSMRNAYVSFVFSVSLHVLRVGSPQISLRIRNSNVSCILYVASSRWENVVDRSRVVDTI